MRSVTSTGTNLPRESTGGFRTEQKEKLLLYRAHTHTQRERERGNLTDQNPHGLHLGVGSDGDQNPQGSQLATGWEREVQVVLVGRVTPAAVERELRSTRRA
jgi:hypothetical protein